MNEELGVIVFEGNIYDLDKMSSEELKELITKMEESYNKLEKETKMRVGIFN